MSTAIQFIQKHGVEKAREAISNCCWMEKSYCTKLGHGCIKNDHDCCVDVDDLKRIVESVDLLKSNGGYEEAKDTFDFAIKHGMNDLTEFGSRLKQAIADYEQLFGNTETLGGEHV